MIAAVLLGGVSIFGGRGALHGVIAGVLLIGVISSAMRLEGYTVNVINIVIGVLLVLSVISTSFLAWVSALTSGGGGRPAVRPAPPQAPTDGRRRSHQRKVSTMKLHNRRLAALAAVALVASVGLTACGGDDDGGDGGGGGGGDVAITMLPKNLGNPYFDTAPRRARRRPRSSAATVEEVGPQDATPDAQVPFINTAAQQGVERAHRLGQRPRRAVRLARRGPGRRREGRHLRLRHQPRVPRPVHQPGHEPRASRRPRST